MDTSIRTGTVIEARGLTRRYRRHAALLDVDLEVPAGRLVGLVGPNGAGKSTLLRLAVGLLRPSAGTIRVLGREPAGGRAGLGDVGFVAQNTPVYAGLTVDEHLQLGARLNPAWDGHLATDRIRQLGLDPRRRAGRLSGGQRAQLALTLAVAKRTELLIFDEPVAALDPLARRQFIQSLLDLVAGLEVTVVLSTHVISDLEQVCDHLIVLADSRVRVAGDVAELLASHVAVVVDRDAPDGLPEGAELVLTEHDVAGARAVVRIPPGTPPPPGGSPVGLEELVLAHLTRAAMGDTTR